MTLMKSRFRMRTICNNMTVSEAKNHKKEDIERLFKSVDWASGEYPERLLKALESYETVISAYNESRLVGLLCAMDDGEMTAYIHYLLVDPEYQSYGVGRLLMEKVKEKYKSYLRIVLICYDEVIGFYEKCGFKVANGVTAMYLTSLRN